MSGTVTGVVEKVFTKRDNNTRGPWAADSLRISVNGEDTGYWYQLGFRENINEEPAMKEGDTVEVEYEDKSNVARTVVSARVVTAKPAAAPAASSGGGSSSTQQNIHYQNSRTRAIAVVDMLLNNKALKLPSAASAAAVAQRYDIILDAVDKITVRFFNDLETFRILDTVADEGEVDTSPDSMLPDEDELLDD